MPRQRAAPKAEEKRELLLDFGTVSEPQAQFLASKTKFTAYGGARGGGKTHIAREKAVGLCFAYPGIKILMVRAHYPELAVNLVDPMLQWLPNEIYSYNGTEHKLTIHTSKIEGLNTDRDSTIKFGHYDSKAAENELTDSSYL